MVLVWNCGSSSIKYYVYDNSLKAIQKGSFSNLNINNLDDFRDTAMQAMNEIKDSGLKIETIAFRVVSAGRGVSDGQEIDEELLLKIEQESNRIIHNKAVLYVMQSSLLFFPAIFHCAYFDTTFFDNLPSLVRKYALPSNVLKNLNVDRYGFHGISHKYVSEIANKHGKLISIHLGAGCSVAAILAGKPIEISMGHSTNEGLIMKSRSGDIDSMLVLEMAEKFGISQTRSLLQKESGLKGLTSSSGEMLTVLDMAGYKIEDDDFIRAKFYSKIQRDNARQALDLYVSRIQRYIGQYAVLLKGVDAVAFTGKIGAGSSFIREMVMADLGFLGQIDTLVIEPDEELAIAKMVLNNKMR